MAYKTIKKMEYANGETVRVKSWTEHGIQLESTEQKETVELMGTDLMKMLEHPQETEAFTYLLHCHNLTAFKEAYALNGELMDVLRRGSDLLEKERKKYGAD